MSNNLILGAILLITIILPIKLIECNNKILTTTNINDVIKDKSININNLNNFNDKIDNTTSKQINPSNDGQIRIVRLPDNILMKYTAYKDVSILHFRIPEDTRTAYFNFKAFDESKSAIRKYLLVLSIENRLSEVHDSISDDLIVRLLQSSLNIKSIYPFYLMLECETFPILFSFQFNLILL